MQKGTWNKIYCEVEDRDLPSSGPCLYQKGGIQDKKVCERCFYFTRILFPVVQPSTDTIPKTKKIRAKKKLNKKIQNKKQRESEPAEVTRRYCMSTVALQISQGVLKYLNDPIGMYNDNDFHFFCEPFLEYAKGIITLSEAQERFMQLLIDFQHTLTEEYHSKILKIFYEYKSGRNFVEDRKALTVEDKPLAYNASQNLVKVFKEAMFMNRDIQRLKENALIEGNKDFNKSLWSSYLDEKPPEKKNRRLFMFARWYEDYILNSSQKEIKNLARKFGLEEDFGAIRKYLNRLGIKKNSGRPLKIKHTGYDPVQKSDIRALKEHKEEFKSYILQTDELPDIQQSIKEIKVQLFKAEP